MSENESDADKSSQKTFPGIRDHEYAELIGVKEKKTDSESGMSLVEMLVSLVILSLILTVTVQSGIRLLAQWQVRDSEREIIRSIEAHRRLALINRQAVRVSIDDIRVPDAAENWQIELSQPVLFSKTGLCNSSHLAITAPGRPVSEYTITPPSCVPVHGQR